MSVIYPSGWSGILVPDLRVVATADSERGPHVGPAAPGDNVGQLVLRTLRTERVAALDDVTLTCSRGGASVTGGLPAEVQVEVGTGQRMGWMEPVVSWGADSASYLATAAPRVTRPGGRSGWWTPLYSDDIDGLLDVPHDLCPADGGQVLAVALEEVGGVVVLHSSVHDSTGARLWSSAQTIDLDDYDPVSTTIREVRVAWRAGAAILLLNGRDLSGVTRDRIYQWTSDDGGVSWAFVGASSDAVTDTACAVLDVAATSAGLLIVWAHQDDLTSSLRATVLASPTQALSAASWVAVDTPASSWDDSDAARVLKLDGAVVVDSDGTAWLLYLTTSAVGYALGSVDGGATWAPAINGASAGRWASPDSSATRPADTDAVAVGGAIVWHGVVSSRLHRLQLGGWTSRGATPNRLSDAGPARGARGSWNLAAWSLTWLPWGTPGGTTWTAAGVASETLIGQLTITYGSAGRAGRMYTASMATSNADAQVVAVRWVAAADGPRTSHQAPVVVGVVAGDGAAAAYGIRIAVGDDEVAVYKRTGATSYTLIGSATAHGFGSSLTEWYARAAFDMTTGDLEVVLVGRLDTGIDLAGRDDWTDVLEVTGAGWNLYGVVSPELAFGSFVESGESGTWREVQWREPEFFSTPGYPDEVAGRPVAAAPICAPPDVLVVGGGGIGAEDDAWTVGTAYDHAADHVLDPNPGLTWQSAGTTEAALTLEWGDHQAGPILGIVLRGVVAEDISVDLWDGSAWVPVPTSSGWSCVGPLDVSGSGSVLRPTSGLGVQVQLREAELDGAYVELGGAVGVVDGTRAGVWGVGDYARASLVTSGWSSGPASSGQALVHARDLALVVEVGNTAYTKARVTLAAAAAAWPDGTCWSVRRALVGAIRPLGDAYGWGRSVRVEVDVEDGRTPDGRIRPRALAPPRRTAEVSWTDGVDTTRAGDGYDPDAIGPSSGGEPIANLGATPWTVAGILEELRGSEGEVVFIPWLELDRLDGALSVATLNRRHHFLHGRIIGSIAIDTAQGDADVDEVVRVNTLTIREEV